MAVTIAEIESELLMRVGPYMIRVGLDGATADGTNAALRGPIRSAIWAVGLGTADPFVPADADVATVAGFDLEKLLDVAELKTLEMCWGNWPWMDQSDGAESQSLSQLTGALERRIEALTVRLTRPYGTPEQTGLVGGGYVSGYLKAGRCTPERTGQPFYDEYGRACYR